MKTIIQFISQKTVIALFVFFIISKASVAQQREIKPDAPEVIETVILKFPDINSNKVYTGVQTALSGTTGVSIRGYCPNADYLFINIDRKYFPKNDDVFQKMTDANFVFDLIPYNDALKIKGLCSESQLVK